jgi:hypothetical protein
MGVWKRVLAAFCLLVVMALIAGGKAEAKYLPSQVTIEGPILHEAIVVDDEAAIDKFIVGFFALPREDIVSSVQPGHLFMLTICREDESGRQIPVDRVIVSLDAAGGAAQLYRLGMVTGWATGDGHWYTVAPDAVATLLGALEQGGVSFDTGGGITGLPSFATVPNMAEPRSTSWYLVAVLMAGLGFGVGAWFGSRRRGLLAQ